MTADTLKSNSITGLDGGTTTITVNGTTYYVNNGIVTGSPNAFGPGHPVVVADYVTPTTGGLVSTSSIYKLVRLRSDVALREIQLRVKAALDTGGASATFLVDLGAYYSDSTTDGTSIANQGTSISANCFLAAHSFGTTADSVASGLAKPGDFVIDGLLSMDPNLLGQPLWKQAGLSSDPGGFIDIVLAVHTAANTAQASNIGIEVIYAD